MPQDVISQLYNTSAIFVSPSPASGYCFSSGNSGDNLLAQIPRVQSCGFSFQRPLESIMQQGQFANVEKIQVSPASATCSLEYLMLDGKAESVLGFNTDGQGAFISGFLSKATAEHNVYASIVPEGLDNIGYTNGASTNVIAIGNAYVESYNMTLAVGQIPKASVSLAGSNFATYTGSQLNDSVAIDYLTDQPVVGVKYSMPTAISYTGSAIPSALRPGEIELQIPSDVSINDFASGVGTMHINSVSMSINPGPDTITALGHFFPIAKKISKPVDCQFSIDALAGDIANGSLATLRCNDTAKNMRVVMHTPGCGPTGAPAIIIQFNNAKLDSRDYSLSVGGGGATVRLNFVAQVGAANDIRNGIIFSGTHMFNTGL